jgi:hypothetical protein
MNHSSPFICNMNALSHEQRLRHGELARRLRSALIAARELADGYEFEFPMDPETYDALTELTPLEHACCSFFTIALEIRPGGKMCWRLSGGEGIKIFIRAEFGLWFEKGSA